MLNVKIIFRLLGVLLLFESIFIFITFLVSLFFNDGCSLQILYSCLIPFGLGGFVLLATHKANRAFGKREGYIIVSMALIVLSVFGALPFIFSGVIPNFTDAFFETMSGFTTTGASVLTQIETVPKSLLFWRSLTQWLGGMGIILLSLAILPFLGVGGVQLFSAEVMGFTPEKMHPKIRATARRLWIIYVGFTVAEIALLHLGGMRLFDALNYSFTSLSTGGFVINTGGIGAYNSPFIEYVIILFMFIGGVNFILPYFLLKFQFKKVIGNEELSTYVIVIAIYTLAISLGLYFNFNYSIEQAIRTSLFQVVSIITTSGFYTVNYLFWPPVLIGLIFTLMFIGASSGSTCGSVKAIRILLIFKNCYFELKRLIHPRAIVPMHINQKTISQSLVNSVLSFIVFYMLTFIVGSILMASMGYGVQSSIGSVAAALGNIGPGLGIFGPGTNYSTLPVLGKWLLSLLMLLGRLEIFTFLVLFAPGFWKK